MMRTTGACRPVAVAGAVTLLALLAAGEAAAQETVTIGGRSLGITQRASTPPPCPSSPDDLNPSEIDIGWVGWPRTIWVAGPSDCSWSVTEDEDWITVSPSPVFGGGTLTIEVTSNTSGAPRTGLVTVVGRSVIVRQGAQCPDEPDELDPSSVAVGSAGGTSRMWASGRSDCEWEVSADQDWITVNPSRVLGDGDPFEISVEANSGGARDGRVRVGDAYRRVEQAAAPCPSAPGVNPAAVTFGADGTGAGGVAVSGLDHCGYDVEVSSGAAAWLSADVTRASGGDTVTLSATANSGPARSGTVTVGAASVQITQENGCPGSPGGVPGGLDFVSSGESKTVTLTEDSGCPYSAATDAAWITVEPASAAGNGTVTISVTAHTGPQRMGTVTIGAASVQITQANGCPASPGGVPGALDFGSSAESQAVALTEDAGCPYPVATEAAWITVRPVSVAGNGTVTISVPAHTGPQRMGTLTIGAASVQITQANGCPASPGGVPSRLDFGSGAASLSMALTEDAGCPYPVATDAAWITVDPASVAGNGTVAISVPVHTGPLRMGTVTIGAASVQITQANGCPASPGGVPARLDFGSGATSRAVPLTEDAGCPYPVAKDADWITVEPASVAGNGTVTVTVPEHTGTAARTGTVTIGLQLVSVTQAGGCQAAPGLTVPLVSFGNGGGALPVGVGESSVCEYAVTADAVWVTVQPARVTGGGTVTVTVPEDLSGGGPRRGTVTIGAAGVRVAQGNTPPVAAADAVTTWRETATPVAVLANDTDADDDPLAVAAVVTAPAQGMAAVSADGQTVTYTSAVGWAGDETFTYQVTDAVGGTAEATVTVTVRAAAPFTDPLLTVGVTPIKAAHMTELRTAVTAAYTACTQTAPAWTDPVLEAGVTPIKAAHLLELREAVIALE